MQKFKSKKTKTTRKMQKSVDNGESSDDDTIYATLPKEQPRPPWSSSTKVVKKGQMMSDPSGEPWTGAQKQSTSSRSRSWRHRKQEQPSSYKKYSIANKSPPRSSGSKFMSKARFAEDLSDRSHVPGSARLAFMDGAYKDSCEIFAQVLLQTGTRREYYNDIIESIRQYFVAEDIRKTG